jgi:hypothetical protein
VRTVSSLPELSIVASYLPKPQKAFPLFTFPLLAENIRVAVSPRYGLW